jgi:MoxR-like ATPase
VAGTYDLEWQSNGSVCGPASVANVARSLGREASESTVLEGSGLCWTGFCMGGLTLEELAGLARRASGRRATVLRDLSVEALRAELARSNDPSVHYIVNFHRGPLFGQGGDEINRAPAKVQSALLEVMAERQVSIGGVTHPLPDPFLVLATQNPIESEGVYPLPEAQRDRFLMKVLVDYPSPEEEREIVYRMGAEPPVAETVLGPEELQRLQATATRVFVHHALVDYVVRLVVATRTPREHGMEDVATWVSYGASPRASLGLIAAARALALVRGRDYVLPQDVLDVTADVLRHRLVLSYDAIADGVPADHIVKRIVQTVPLPQVAPRQRAGGFGPSSPGGPSVPQGAPQGPAGYGPAPTGPYPTAAPVPGFAPGAQAGPQAPQVPGPPAPGSQGAGPNGFGPQRQA